MSPVRAQKIAPLPQPEYPLFSHGGLGCESVRQESCSGLESSAQLFFALLSVLLYVARRTRSSSTRRSASNSTKNFIPKCAGAASARSAAAAPWPSPACPTGL